MKNMSKIKKGLKWLACAVIAFAMTLSCFSLTQVSTVKAETPVDYSTINVTDGQFPSTSSSIIKTATNWTDSYIGDFTGDVISGIINLSPDSDSTEDFMEKTMLDSYAEFESEKPTTPFGRNTTNPNGNWYFPNTNSNVLMINTNDVESNRGTAFGYTSQPIDLTAYSFYKFSAWVKTGDFVQDRGAVIKLSGFDYDIGFWNIDNHDQIENNMLGFTEYVIYVATAGNSVSANVNLQVGDSYTYGTIGTDEYIEHITPSSGYAFFDNVTCTKLSANAYYEETADVVSDNVIVKDFNSATGVIESEILTSKLGQASFDMGSFANGLQGWQRVFKDGTDSGQALYVGAYDAAKPFDSDNNYGLSENPYTPYGNRDYLSDRNILVLSADSDANVGVESDEFVIERNKFYRLSVWANTQNFDNNSNASIVLAGESNIASNNYELNPIVIGSVEGSGDINARYGWTRYSFYIRGSVAKTCAVKLQLWLGYSNNCSGTVLFDEILFEEVTYSYYNNNYSAGTSVTFDSVPSTTIDNGRFYEAENFGDEYPLVPVQWTAFGEGKGNAVNGVILTDEEHYNANFTKYLSVPNPVSQATNEAYNAVRYPSMLLIAADELSHFGYSASAITIASATDYKISVTMRTINMTGAGASIWLDVNGITIASVKNIASTSEFVTYEFYLQGDSTLEDGTGIDYTATLYIGMGNKSAKGSGSIYVAEAALETLSEGDFDAKYAQFKEERADGINYDMYSFSSLDFFGYDNTDTTTIKNSTSWSVIETAEQAQGSYETGVFNPLKKDNNAGNTYIPAEITTAYNKLENKFDNVYTIHTRNTAVTTQLINPLKLEADSYYMVSISMAVIIHEDSTFATDSYGASLYLTGEEKYSNTKFTNVRTTTNLVDTYEFRTYQFYIATANTATTLYLRAALGDIAYPNRYVSGELYISYVSLVNLGSSDEDIVETETLKIIDNHVDAEENEDEEVEDETTAPTDNEKWWLIPSILFGVAIILAIVGAIIRSAITKRANRKTRAQLSSYDRRYGYPESIANNSEFDDDKSENEVVIEQVPEKVKSDIDNFNDDEEIVPAKKETATLESKVEKEQNVEDTNEFDD